MAVQTVDEIRTLALFLVGEPTTSASGWYAQAVTYIDEVQRALIAGGTVGEIRVEGEDWTWAIQNPRGRIRLLPPFNSAYTRTFTFTKDSATVTVSSMTTGLSLVDYYLVASSSVATDDGAGGFVAKVTAHTASATTMTIDRSWPYTTASGTDVRAVLTEYDLASDFVRFVSPFFAMSDQKEQPIGVIGAASMEDEWPLGEIAEGVPQFAALIGMDSSRVQQIRFSHYPRAALDLEYEYIYLPSALSSGSGTPVLPEIHRRVLALGAAYLIATDKQNARREPLGAQFANALNSIQQEFKTNATRGSAEAGMILPRGRGRDPRRLLRTSSGSIIG